MNAFKGMPKKYWPLAAVFMIVGLPLMAVVHGSSALFEFLGDREWIP